jgi:hypothetical protein
MRMPSGASCPNAGALRACRSHPSSKPAPSRRASPEARARWQTIAQRILGNFSAYFICVAARSISSAVVTTLLLTS